ncbi:MAG: hypothetical protein LUD41_05070 [Phascolarctobacterium sp.]|nr:hypothetical protein [Phascolarctobacterium sp.]
MRANTIPRSSMPSGIFLLTLDIQIMTKTGAVYCSTVAVAALQMDMV